MKNSILKSTVIPFLSVCLLAGNTAFASGSGRNGPDESGISIPVKVDRVLTAGQFVKAVSACEKPALISLFSQAIRQPLSNVLFSKRYENLLNMNINSEAVLATINIPIYYGSSSSEADLVFRNNRDDLYESLLRSVPHVFRLRVESRENREYPTLRMDPEITKQLVAAAQSNATYTGGITIHIDVKKDSGRDALGNFNADEMYVLKYHVVESPIFRLVRNLDPYKTELKLSAEDFKQCLQNQMQ